LTLAGLILEVQLIFLELLQLLKVVLYHFFLSNNKPSFRINETNSAKSKESSLEGDWI